MTTDAPPQPPKLFSSLRLKLWIALGCVAVLVAGALTRPPSEVAVAPPQERTAPLLGEEVQRREQLRIFADVQALGPRLARHTVSIPRTPGPEPLPSDLTPATGRAEPAGHGLIVSTDGEVLTSAGALDGRETVTVTLADGTLVDARIVAFDADSDMVLLRGVGIPATDAAPWATSAPQAGMLAVAVTHDAGNVAVAPVFVAGGSSERRIRLTTAELPGGTPIFTLAGEVFAVASGGDSAAAVLVASAVARMRELVASGQSRRGALGVTFQPIEGALQEVFPAGALVAEVTPNGPAEEAGLDAGDVIVGIGESAIASVDEARQAIAALQRETVVPVRLVRRSQTVTIPVTATSALGLRVRRQPPRRTESAPEARRLFDAATRDAAGVLPHTRILSIGGQGVASVDQARAALKRAKGPIVIYAEDERGRFFRVVERSG